jgi:hypothetical protein
MAAVPATTTDREKTLTAREKEIARLCAVDNPNLSVVADLMGVPKQFIQELHCRPEFQDYVRGLRLAAQAQLFRVEGMLAEAQEKAAGWLSTAMDADTDEIGWATRLKYAEAIMDRHPGGHFVKRSKSEHTERIQVVDDGAIQQLRQKSLSLGIRREDVIDVEPDEVRRKEELAND